MKRYRFRITVAQFDPAWKFLRGFALCPEAPPVVFIPGLLADSAAMLWGGFAVLLFFMIMAIATRDDETLTADEAIDRIRELRALERRRTEKATPRRRSGGGNK